MKENNYQVQGTGRSFQNEWSSQS